MALTEKIIDAAIEQLVQEAIAMTANKGWQALQKSHKALSLLKKAGLVNLEKDFGAVYLFALAEYGAEKEPKDLVRLFAEKEVRMAFEKDFREKTEDSPIALEHHLHTNPKLIGLKPLFPNLASLYPEIKEFKEVFERKLIWTSDPVILHQFNELNAGIFKLLEENRRNSFEYQAERYLMGRIDDFQKNYLEGNKFVPLNGVKKETRYLTSREMMELAKSLREGLKLQSLEDAQDVIVPETEKESIHFQPSKAFKNPQEPTETTYRPLDRFINLWLQNPNSRLLVIMGEYGTGKTTFTRHLTHQLACQHLNRAYSGDIRDEKRRIPLYLPLRDFEKSVENFVSDQCSNKYSLSSLNFAEFKNRVDNDELVVIFDGFDEMTQRTDADEKQRNFTKIRNLLDESPRSKFVLTCREEYFQSQEDMLKVFDGDAGLDIVHLLPFDDEQIRQFLRSHTDDPDALWEKIDKTFDLKDLAKRPVLLELIVKHLPKLMRNIREDRPVKTSDLYEACIEEELDRVDEKIRFAIPGKYRLEILKRLANWMYHHDTLSFDTRQIGQELQLKALFNTKEEWEYEKRLSEFLTFTFLLREDDYQFRISHKSFRDYLAALFFVEEINKNEAQHFSRTKLTEELRSFMLEHPLDEKTLLYFVLSAKNLPEESRWQGSNAANLLLRLNDKALAGQNLSECYLPEVNFKYCDLTETVLYGAVLTGSGFTDSVFKATSISKADFSDCSLSTSAGSLSGVENLKGLKTLYCSYNQISDLSPLSGLSSLQTLHCNSNQISDLSPLSGLSSLQTLWCDSNQIGDLSPLSGLSSLQSLYCFSNQIGDLSPLSGLSSLQSLHCHSNQVSDLSPLSGLSSLQSLSCGYNQISDLSPLSRLSSLQSLYCLSNQISDLSPLSGLSSLQTLWCDSNQISDLSPLSGLLSLQTLDCFSNQISDLSPLSGLSSLQSLDCHSNQISDLSPLSGLSSLQSLRVSENQFGEQELASLKKALPKLKIEFR